MPTQNRPVPEPCAPAHPKKSAGAGAPQDVAPRISAEETLRDLVRDYQALLSSKASPPEVRAAADAALAPIAESIRKFAYISSRRRHGPSARDQFDDTLAEAYALALEELAGLNLAKTTSVRNAVLQGLIHALPDAGTLADRAIAIPKSWERVARVAASAGAELTQKLGREPTRAEVREETATRCRRWAKDHGHHDVTGQLRKQGTLGALEHFDALLAADRHPLSFDTPAGDVEGDTLYDVVADPHPAPTETATFGCLANPRLLALATGDLPSTEREAIGEFLAGRADELPDIKRHTRAMAARLCAPHAQYAYLSPSITQVFDPAPERAPRRMAPALPVG